MNEIPHEISFTYARPDDAESIDEALTEYVVSRHDNYIDTLRAQKEQQVAEAAALLAANAHFAEQKEENATVTSKNTSFLSMFF